MYRYYICKVKKGNIVIYAMLVGLLLISISLALFKFELETKKSLSYRRKSLVDMDKTNYRREKLFTSLYAILRDKGINLNKASIIQYMKNNGSVFKLDFDGMSLRFDSEKEQLLIVYNYNTYYNRVEYYDLNLLEGKLFFNLLSSDLVGRYDYVY